MKALNIPTIDFVGKRTYAIIVSLALIAVSIFSLSTQGLKLGIDFTGGTLIEVGYEQDVNLSKVRNTLSEASFKSANVQYFGSTKEILIRLEPQAVSSAKLSSKIIQLLGDDLQLQTIKSRVDIRRVEFVGPKVGEELTNDGGLAMLYALIGILIYVAIRFEYRFALGSISALIHDVIITLGVFSLLQIEFDLTVLAAILAVIGYSLNDTIVVFDRIRENFLSTRHVDPAKIVNGALNQTLSRTIMTSLTTLLVLMALFFLGGEIIHSFALALLIGVVIGTYSSIYVASSMILALGISKEDLLPSEKEEKEIDARP
jgi:preprotein translocase subunit SecF